MAWTYTADPASSPTDAVRFLIQDTNSADPQLTDAEVLWLISQAQSDIYQAAIQACSTLAAKYARRSDKTTGDLQIRSSSISKQYADLRVTLMAQAKRFSPATPYAGGIRVSDGETDRDNDDMIQPAIRVGMMDSRGGTAGLDDDDVTREFFE